MKSTKNRDRNITHFLYVLPNLIMYSFLSIVPIVLGLYYSFTNWNGIGKNYKFVGLKNYIKILSDNRFRKAVLFNIRYAAMLIICVMLLSVVLALLMNTKIRGQNCFRAIYFFPACVSMLTIGLIFNYIFFQGIPSLGTSLGIEALQKNILSGRSTAIYGILITNIWKSVAIPTVLVISALQTIPGEIIEAAIVDGANGRQRFYYITLRYILPILSIIFVLGISDAEASAQVKTSGRIWIAGDSIAADHSYENEADYARFVHGWGEVIGNYLNENAQVFNMAISGQSAKYFVEEDNYKKIIDGIGEGDLLLIQFGHNDYKSDGVNHYSLPTSTEGSYKYYLKTKFIDPIYEKGGRVILASSVVRHLFDGEKLGEQTHGVYAKAMEELAEECKSEGKEVYFIDTFSLTEGIYNRLGEVATEKLHAVIGKGADAKLDDTHYSPYGAVYMASLIGQQLKELGIPCLSDTKKAWLIEDDSDKISKERAALDKFSFR